MKTLSLKFVLILTLLLAITSKECGNNDIEGCDICGTGINANKCSKCSSKYFSVFDGEKCIKCDDSILAMAGCGGNCKLLNKTERNVQCDENSCKEGFYEIFPGTCATCSFLSSDCTKCSYSKEEGSDEKIFKCLECKNYYYPSSDGYCYYGQIKYCQKYLDETHCLECYYGYALYPNGTCLLYHDYNCKKPIYSEEKNKVICSKCYEGYYLNPDGVCENYISSCLNAIYSQEKQSGICLQCKDGYYISSDSKSCEICRYVSKDYFSYCKKCHLDDSNDVLCEEISNNEYYIYNSGKNIRQCGSKISKCEKCSYNNEEGGDFNEENLLCDECQANTYLSADRKECKNCLVENGCIKCSDEDKNYCDKCSSGYSLYSDGSCAKCSDHFGAGCESCSLSIYDLSFYCESCSTGYVFGIDGKCKDCSNEEDVNLSNCNTCRNLGNNNYECLECKNQDYILFEGKCLSRTEIDEEFSLCNELVNLGTKDNKIYSCVKCRDSEYIFSVREDGSSICIQSSSLTELNYCSLSKRETLSDKSYNYTCIKCKDNNNRELKYDGDLKKETCQCISGYYQYNSGSTCRNCNFFIYNCQTCHEDNDDIICDTCFDNYVKTNYNSCTRCNIDSCEKCSFGEDNNLKCDKYKEPYFLSNESKIESCSSKIDNCVSCSYKDEKMTDLKCDKCLDNYSLNMNHECQKCYINTDFGPSCLSCTDNEKLKETAPCQKCQENYFLTKNNTCVYCKSEKYGGMFCEQCGYISYNNKEKIGCLKCKNSDDYAVTDEGKCFDIYNAKCKTAGSYINKNNEKVFGCTSCYDYYYLNDEHECISIPMENCLSLKVEDGIKLCTSCKNGYQLIENRCIQIIPEESNQKIEGCSYYNFKNNFYYCINCNSNYVLNNGYCFKKPNSPLLSKCSYYKIDKNFIQCNSCSSYNYYNNYINNKLVCTNILGQCSSMENIGTDFNPKYTCKSCPDDAEMEDDNGITHCVSNILKNRCVQGNINTYYYTNIYSCTKCDPLYILSYSSYDEKYICKYIYEEEKPKVDISKYANDKGVATTNGKCEDKYFTRNGKVCIKCDDNTYGMPGCGGNCQFNKDREYQLKCDENQCKEGYFETLPGQCKVCDSALSYCSQCSYINTNNEEISILPKRKRKLICNECKEGFILENGVCKTCSEIISGCSECIFENEQIKCKTTYPEYYFDIEGNIQRCQENCARCILENQKPKCLDASHGYFINNERKIISCSDEKEGMVGCYQCTFDTNLKCTYCYYKYELINNECKSIIELYKLDNCKYYHTFYNESKKFYQCYECENNYFLDVNTKKCIKSTEETKLCKSANVLKINDKIVYNCSNCINYDNSLVQNTDGFYSCYNQELTKLVSKDCQLIVNKGTFDEPIFSCERCSYYRYYKILVMNEYEIQYCEYNSYFITNCIKGTVRDYYSKNDYGETYTLEKEYNCTQCALKYELVYDNKTEKYTCNPLECGIPFCKKCKDNDVYTCEECLTGFTLNRLGLCYIKPPKPPTITFKDIFRFALNGNFELDGNNIFRYAYRLRGITTDSISDKHSFIIKTMFSSNNGLRALDDDTKALDTSCQFKEKMDSEGSDLKYVDYECSFDSVNEELSNHKMTSIKEDTEENDNMNAVNLEDLVNKVENIERKESTFNINELNKYVSFTVNEDSKQINATNNTNYAFIINGTTDKVISNKIIGKLEIIGSNENVNCEIDAKDKDKASIDCTTDMSEIIKQLGITQYSFKTREIISDNNNVYFNGLNDVKIIIPVEDQEVEPEEEEEGQKEKEKEPNNPENPEKSKKSNTGLIVGLVVGGVVVIGIITFLILFFKMRKNNNPISDMNNNDHNTNKDVVISYQAKNDQKGTSSNRNMN